MSPNTEKTAGAAVNIGADAIEKIWACVNLLSNKSRQEMEIVTIADRASEDAAATGDGSAAEVIAEITAEAIAALASIGAAVPKHLKKRPAAKINHAAGLACLRRRYDLAMENAPAAVSLSDRNSKMGAVPNISLPPVFTCPNCAGCIDWCYAIRAYNRSQTTADAWTGNYKAFLADAAAFFAEISGACYSFRFFRWFVSGDIVNYEFFSGMVKTAAENPHCNFLAFTKAYAIVNEYVDNNGGSRDAAIPQNLHVLFSAAPCIPMINPHHFPECHVNFADPRLNTFRGCTGRVHHCDGSCEECLKNRCGCFELQTGDAVIINQH